MHEVLLTVQNAARGILIKYGLSFDGPVLVPLEEDPNHILVLRTSSESSCKITHPTTSPNERTESVSDDFQEMIVKILDRYTRSNG